MKYDPLVGIVVLNWNGFQDTQECIKSLLQINYKNYFIIIVDNGSTLEQRKLLQTLANPKVKVVQLDDNLGYSGGNNVGIKTVLAQGAEYILLLNNDTVVHNDFLDQLVRCSLSSTAPSIIGATITYYQSDEIFAIGGGKTNFWIDDFALIGSHKKLPYSKSVLPGYISGCCMLIDKRVIAVVGLLSEDFFLYNEESDYCLRSRRYGLRLEVSLDSKVEHKVARSTKHMSHFYVYYMIRNKLLLARRHARWYQCISFVPVFIVREIIGYTVLSMLRNKKALGAPWLAIFDFIRGNYGRTLYPKN